MEIQAFEYAGLYVGAGCLLTLIASLVGMAGAGLFGSLVPGRAGTRLQSPGFLVAASLFWPLVVIALAVALVAGAFLVVIAACNVLFLVAED